jgi:flavin-dependent dehydrogenase
MTGYKNENSIPIIDDVELLVIGGGLAGIPIAYRSAYNGKRTLIIEQKTFLGYEIGLWQRPWMEWNKEQEKLVKNWLPFDEQQSFESQSITTIHMDKYKRKLEDKLIGAAVNILYGTIPVKCIKKFDKWEVIVGNKSGRQIVSAKNIIDTTDTNILLYLLKEDEYNYICVDNGGAAVNNIELARRTIEFISVKKDYQNCYSVPEEIGVYNNKVNIYPGAFSDDHVLIDIPVEIKGLESRNLITDAEIEYRIRRISLKVGSYLVNNTSAFAGSRLGMGSLQVMRSKDVSFIELLAFDENFDLNGLQKCHCIILGKNEVPYKNKWSKDYLEYDINSDLEYREISEFNKLYKFPEVKPAQMSISILDSGEVLVIGGGTGGAVAARVAAQESANTVLLEMNSVLGGTGTIGGVSSYWFGNRDSFTREVDQKVRLWADKLAYPTNSYGWGPSDSWNSDIKAFVLAEMCIKAGVKLYLNCITIGAIMKSDEFEGVIVATPYGPFAVLSDVSIDSTGDGDAAVFAGAEYLYGNQRDRMTMWASLAQYKAPGQYKNNFTTTADVGDVFDYTRFILAGRRRGAEDLYDHGSYVAPRESRHIKGEYEITLIDQLLMKSFPDTISICFSNHDPKGKSTADIIYFGILPPQLMLQKDWFSQNLYRF